MLQGGAVAILGRAAAGGSRGCALSIDEFACHEWDTRDHTGAIRSMVAIDEAAHADENAKVDRRVGGAMTIESSNQAHAQIPCRSCRRLRSAMYRTARVANLVTPARVAAALGEACARWRDRSFAPRRETVAAIAAAWGWSEELLDESIDALLAPFSIVALEDLARCVPQRSALVGLIMAGNIPGAGIHEIALALIAGCALLVKTSTAEPIFFARFAQTLREIDAEIGARIAVVNWSRERGDLMAALRANCDWLAAFGADETIATLASNARFAPSWHPPSSKATAAERGTAADNDQVADNVTGAARLAAGFGSRVSAALVATGMVPGAPATALADALARDVSLFEQQGCLSPHHIYVESSDGGAAREFARELAAALERCTAKWPPPRRYGLQEAAAVRRVRESARWRALGGDTVLMLEGAGLGWTVIYDDAANFTPSPGYRTVTVSPIRDLDDLRRRLQPVASRIEAFAIAAPPGRRERLHTALAALGICYLCEPGAMQSPPLDWNHGGGVFIRALVNSQVRR